MLAGCADGGDAVSLLQVSAARVEVGKNGLTADGLIPSIEVESDGYWRVFAESSAAVPPSSASDGRKLPSSFCTSCIASAPEICVALNAPVDTSQKHRP